MFYNESEIEAIYQRLKDDYNSNWLLKGQNEETFTLKELLFLLLSKNARTSFVIKWAFYAYYRELLISAVNEEFQKGIPEGKKVIESQIADFESTVPENLRRGPIEVIVSLVRLLYMPEDVHDSLLKRLYSGGHFRDDFVAHLALMVSKERKSKK